MSIEKDKNIISIKPPSGTIEIRQHPEEVIDVAPEILASMEARLKGESFLDVYGDEDRVSNEFLIRKETEKLMRIFGNANEVSSRFSSVKSINEIKKELRFEEVDIKFLNKHALMKSGGAFVDECDLYIALLTRQTIKLKKERLRDIFLSVKGSPEFYSLLKALEPEYISENLTPLKITKEIIRMDPMVAKLVRADQVVDKMNDLLKVFYGRNQ